MTDDREHPLSARETPLFSVVVPAYNAAETLAETLDALQAQTLETWECVVVDDGSSDNTRAIAEEFVGKDPRMTVIHQQNQGSAGAYNTGVRNGRGDFVVICSADDILLPNHLEAMASFIDAEPDYDIYSSNGYFWLPGQSRELVYSESDRGEITSLSLAEVILWCFYSVGAAYRREWHDRVGGYRLDVFGEDYDFWMRAMAMGARHRYTPEALSLHRKTDSQKSADVERAYLSDIRLVSDLADHYELDEAERLAVAQCIEIRKRYIEEMHAAGGPPDRPTLASRVVARIHRIFDR